MLVNEMHLRHIMLYEFNKGVNATLATVNICQVYGEGVLDKRKCQYWFQRFRTGDYSLEDKERSGRPNELDIEHLKSVVEANPRVSSRELAAEFNLSQTTIINYLKQLGKVPKLGVWVPHVLTPENLRQRMSIASLLYDRQLREPFLERVVTGDEKWVLYNNPSRKRSWVDALEPALPIPKPGLHPKKVLLCIWWDRHGIIYYELLNQGETINADAYCRQLTKLNEAIQKNRPVLANRKGVILQHDNARPHVAEKTLKKISGLGWEVLPHPPYSPDLAPSDYHLFRSLSSYLANKFFNSFDEVKNALLDYFASKNEKFFSDGIEKLMERWSMVVEQDDNYVID